jgi:hypothetical protein
MSNLENQTSDNFVNDSIEWESEESEQESMSHSDVFKSYESSYSIERRKQRKMKKRLAHKAEKKKLIDKMVGLLKVEQNPDKILVVDDSMSKWEVAFTIIISFVFFFNFVMSIDIYASFEVRNSVAKVLETTPFDTKENKFENINNLEDLDLFFSKVLIQQVSNTG